jgi:prolyl oligopeptidase
MIPLSIIHRRNLKLKGQNPVLLAVYGSDGLAFMPDFLDRQIPLLEDGGVIAIAHVRGGGEYGEAWHQAGQLATKPNTYKDLIACAEFLVAKGYGSAATLAIKGSIGGGLAVGMATTARPDLFRVVFNDIGYNNTLRAEQVIQGDAIAREYGSTKTKAGFEALYAVDATQHVRPGTPYPAVFLSTGYSDRMAPFQPSKMTAHLQAATTSGRPVILRVYFDAGHGVRLTRAQREREFAEQLGFFYWQIGKRQYQPKAH